MSGGEVKVIKVFALQHGARHAELRQPKAFSRGGGVDEPVIEIALRVVIDHAIQPRHALDVEIQRLCPALLRPA